MQSFQYIHEYELQYTFIHGAFPLLSISPCYSPFLPFCSPLDPLLLTWNPPSCDRNRPPRSQVACKLTLPCPTLHPNPPPSKFPEPQLAQRLTKTTSGIFRTLLSGTWSIYSTLQISKPISYKRSGNPTVSTYHKHGEDTLRFPLSVIM
jgi:hypothetical protein